jgi:hypothetical protein
MTSRQTKFDRVVIVLEEIIPIFRDNPHKISSGIADFLEKNLNNIKQTKSEKRETGSAQLQFLGELLDSSNRHNNEYDDALEKSRAIFGREFPDFFAKIITKRNKIIERGKIRNEDEFYLIRDFVDELEGDHNHDQLLGKLYEMVDIFDVQP